MWFLPGKHQDVRVNPDPAVRQNVQINGEADHVHILYEADPFTAPGSLANIVKTKTSRFARKEYGETILKKYYWKPYFWSDSYFVTTVSENSLAVVQDYIRNQ